MFGFKFQYFPKHSQLLISLFLLFFSNIAMASEGSSNALLFLMCLLIPWIFSVILSFIYTLWGKGNALIITIFAFPGLVSFALYISDPSLNSWYIEKSFEEMIEPASYAVNAFLILIAPILISLVKRKFVLLKTIK